jgi:hypothetical protein
MEIFYFFKTLSFDSINIMWHGKLYIGTFVDTNKVQSKYNVIISKFKLLFILECYVHIYIMIKSLKLHYVLMSFWCEVFF